MTVVAALQTPPAPRMPAAFERALVEACAAVRRTSREQDQGVASAGAGLIPDLIDMERRFRAGGYPVQASHVRAAVDGLVGKSAPRTGDVDEETLERERLRRLDDALDHLQLALAAHCWRDVVRVEAWEADVAIGAAA